MIFNDLSGSVNLSVIPLVRGQSMIQTLTSWMMPASLLVNPQPCDKSEALFRKNFIFMYSNYFWLLDKLWTEKLCNILMKTKNTSFQGYPLLPSQFYRTN